MSLLQHSELSWGERQSHLDLSTRCQFDGSSTTIRSGNGYKNLCNLLGLIPDVVNRHSSGIFCLHHCPHDSTHGWCTNPHHLSFGSPKENTNMIDQTSLSERTRLGWSEGRRVRQGEEIVKRMGWNLLLTSPSGEEFTANSCREASLICGCGSKSIRQGINRNQGIHMVKRGSGRGWTIEKV